MTPWSWFPDAYELPAGSLSDPPLFREVLDRLEPEVSPVVVPIRRPRKRATSGKARP